MTERTLLRNAIASIALGVLLLASANCTSPCQDEEVLKSHSPKGPHHFQAVVRNCGPTTPYVTVVRVIAGKRSVEVAQFTDRPVIEVRWQSVKHASVAYAHCGPGEARVGEASIPGLTVEVVADPALAARCGPRGYWEPSL